MTSAELGWRVGILAANILVIDDDQLSRKLLADALGGEYSVQTAASGREGLALAEASPPDLILLDVKMPEMDGFETCRLIKTHPALRRIPVFFLAADSAAETQLKGFDLGAVDWLTKPLHLPLLLRRIRKVLESEALRRSLEERQGELEAMVNTIPDLLFTLDRRGTYLKVFAHQSALLSRQKELLLGHTVAQRLPAEPAARVMAAIEEADAHGTSYGTQIELQLDDGVRWFELSVAKNTHSDPLDPHFVMLSRDISGRKEAELRAHRLALHDPLTGLANRNLFGEIAERAIASAQREHSLLALVFIDLDRFKPINDDYGHAVGDLVLQQACQRMLACIRATDTAGRVGGDEFVLLLPDLAQRDNVLQVAEKVRSALNEPFMVGDICLSISSSIGIALYPEHGAMLLDLIKHADEAMYSAKEAGRNRICVSDYAGASIIRTNRLVHEDG